jgi:hypothetical protein
MEGHASAWCVFSGNAASLLNALGILGITLATEGLQGGHLGRQGKETAAKIAALQFLDIECTKARVAPFT